MLFCHSEPKAKNLEILRRPPCGGLLRMTVLNDLIRRLDYETGRIDSIS
jgi:hypothetical protein